MIRIPGYCSFDPEKTVLCHDSGGGMGAKVSDLQGAWGCSPCHSVVDGQTKTNYTHAEIRLMFYEGMSRTLAHVSKLIEV